MNGLCKFTLQMTILDVCIFHQSIAVAGEFVSTTDATILSVVRYHGWIRSTYAKFDNTNGGELRVDTKTQKIRVILVRIVTVIERM